MDNDEIYTINVSSLVDYNSTIDISTIGGETIEVQTIGLPPGQIWLNTNENKYYVNDGADWNLVAPEWKNVEWVNSLPDIQKVKEMCEEYPALEKAYENFKSIYKLVEQDWAGKQKDRNKPPF